MAAGLVVEVVEAEMAAGLRVALKVAKRVWAAWEVWVAQKVALKDVAWPAPTAARRLAVAGPCLRR